MTNARTRVAVVGTGAWWGRQHAIAFSIRTDATLCAVVGRTPERAAQRAGEFDVPGYTDIEEMLDRERPDLVSVCLPNEGHFEPTRQIIRAGFPLLVEKPLVFELDQADALIAEAAGRELFFAINFNHRYARPVRLAEAAIRAGALGRLTFAWWRFGGEPGTSRHPHANLIETQCHGLDLLEHLCGPVESVMGQMSDATGRGYSTLTVALRFAAGAVGSLVGTYDSSYSYPGAHLLEVNGLDGRILVEDTVRRYTYTPAGDEMSQVWQAGYFNDRDRDFHATFDRYLDDLLPAFVEGRPPPVPATAGRRALQLAHAVIESHACGTRVPTPLR
ncbi:Gfo/Idh/MocA family protein [Pseudonocardia lacus]|uniref:Gfo/Idh/MocA family protein n=1 Tax=Pseudonocardia lacus TaxID=2835865 RepID=UPI001BDC8082|nr:Gfo/Idh/MocA family oxidoreductase [Pseudonocardia lacus]